MYPNTPIMNGADSAVSQDKPETVKEFWNKQADQARKMLQNALTQAAKAEVLGIHDYPIADLRNFAFDNESNYF